MPRFFDDPFVWHPLRIALCPLPVLFGLWIFFAITFIQPLPLPDNTVLFVQAHFQSATWFVSVIGTLIATYVSYFFSLAVRYHIAIRLATTPIPLEVLTSATRIAQQTFWWHNPQVKWTWIVLLPYIGVGFQASGLIAFFTVREVTLSYPLAGEDLDLSDPQWLRTSHQITLIPPPSGALASLFLQGVMMDSMLSGENTANSFNLNGYNYLGTTGGIHPATCIPTRKSDQFFANNENLVKMNQESDDDELEEESRLGVIKNLFALPFNKSMELTQQGFTADVDCRNETFHDMATYRPNLTNLVIAEDGLTMVFLNATCPDSSTTTTTEAVSASYNITDSFSTGGVLAVACPIPDSNSFDVIIKGTGWYDSILNYTICTVTPKLTFVNVTYIFSLQNSSVPTAVRISTPINETDIAVWGRSAIDILLNSIFSSQSARGSNLGMAFFSGWMRNTTLTPNDMFADAMTTYIRAAVEFAGTVIRVFWRQQPGYLAKAAGLDVNDPVYTPIDGTFFATTYGWHQSQHVSPLFLLPTTLIIIATHGILVWGFIHSKKHRDSLHEHDLRFDPTDIVHIIAAQAPETRMEGFQNFSHLSTSYMRRTTVQMQNRLGIRAFTVSMRPVGINDRHDGSRQPLIQTYELDNFERERRDRLSGSTAVNASSANASGSAIYNRVEGSQGRDLLKLNIDFGSGLGINLMPNSGPDTSRGGM